MKNKFFLQSRIDEVRSATLSNFKLHLHGCGYHGYVGWDGLVNSVGLTNAIQASQRALLSKDDTYHRKLRDGIRIDFYAI